MSSPPILLFDLNRKKRSRDDDAKRYVSRYIRMVKAIFKVCQRQAVPKYSSKYSRRDFTLWRHLAIPALMQRIGKSYREYTNDFLTVTELRTQLVTSIKLKRGPCDDNGDFKPVVEKAHEIKPIKVGIGDKDYDDEKNHELLRDELDACR